jgi:hypothetical protein
VTWCRRSSLERGNGRPIGSRYCARPGSRGGFSWARAGERTRPDKGGQWPDVLRDTAALRARNPAPRSKKQQELFTAEDAEIRRGRRAPRCLGSPPRPPRSSASSAVQAAAILVAGMDWCAEEPARGRRPGVVRPLSGGVRFSRCCRGPIARRTNARRVGSRSAIQPSTSRAGGAAAYSVLDSGGVCRGVRPLNRARSPTDCTSAARRCRSSGRVRSARTARCRAGMSGASGDDAVR